MSLMNDFLIALESEIRAAVSGIPAGVSGVERGVRSPDKIQAGQYPHVFLTDPTEKSEELIYRQRKIEVSVLVVIWRLNQSHNDSLEDFSDIKAALSVFPSLGSVNLDNSEIELEQIWETYDKPYRAAVMRVTGVRTD